LLRDSGISMLMPWIFTALVLSQLEFTPVMVKVLIRGRMNPLRTEPGFTVRMTGGFALTVNAFSQMISAVPLSSVTVIFPVDCGASSAIVTFALIWVALVAITLFTVMPVHPKATVMPPSLVRSMFCTATATSAVAPALTAGGVMLTQLGSSLILVVVVVALIDVVDVIAAAVVELVVLTLPPPPPPPPPVLPPPGVEVVVVGITVEVVVVG
jgi:hypothetical protein